MYQINDRIAAIKEIQRLLGISQTGKYDSETKDKVLNIQESYGIEKTGTVDYTTFNAILTEHNQNNSAHMQYLYAPNYPYAEGDMNENVYMIHNALSPVLKDYRYDGDFPSGKYLGKSTINAVNYLRSIFGMLTSDKIDEKFINRLLLERDLLELKSAYGK